MESKEVKNINPTRNELLKECLTALICKPIPRLAKKMNRNCDINIKMGFSLSLELSIYIKYWWALSGSNRRPTD